MGAALALSLGFRSESSPRSRYRWVVRGIGRRARVIVGSTTRPRATLGLPLAFGAALALPRGRERDWAPRSRYRWVASAARRRARVIAGSSAGLGVTLALSRGRRRDWAPRPRYRWVASATCRRARVIARSPAGLGATLALPRFVNSDQ